MPHFFFAVGPNGAGKSSLAANLVPKGTVIINGDEIRRESKSLPAAEHKTKLLLEGAVILNRPIYYESNFLDPRDRDFYLSFREQDYSIHLLYFGLNTVDESVQRVSQRTSLGGHTVPFSTIEMNFKHNVRNSISNYRDFDSVTLVDNPVNAGADTKIVFVSEKGNEIFRDEPLPKWADRLLYHVSNPLAPLPYANELDDYRPLKR